jgi:hypothetical protein
MADINAFQFEPQHPAFRLSCVSMAEAVFYAAIQRDEAVEAGRMQEAARWQAVLRAIDELERVKPGPGVAIH